MLQNNDDKQIIINFLTELTNLNLKDVIFDGIEKFQGIAEYDFYLINLIGITEKGSKENIFVKTIKKGKIKESLFCICDLACEKYLNNNYTNDNSKKLQKISILEEKKSIKNINKVSVKLFENDLKIAKANIDIYFIEILKFIEQIKNKCKERGLSIEINHKDIIIVGVKNKH